MYRRWLVAHLCMRKWPTRPAIIERNPRPTPRGPLSQTRKLVTTFGFERALIDWNHEIPISLARKTSRIYPRHAPATTGRSSLQKLSSHELAQLIRMRQGMLSRRVQRRCSVLSDLGPIEVLSKIGG